MNDGFAHEGQIDPGDGNEIHYRWDGPREAPVLLLVNSLGTTLHMWDAQAGVLAERFRVLRYDGRGHGRSSAPAGPYSIERLGLDAVALLDGLGVERADVCGLSIGGMVGQWLGVNASRRVRRLILANTAAIMGPPQLWDERIAAVKTGGMRAVCDAVVERWFTPEFRAAQPREVAGVREMIETTPVAGYTGACAAIRDMDQRADLPAISMPTLVIVGTRDPSTPPAQGREIAAAVPGSRTASLPTAHLSNVEQPACFTELVRDFLNES